MGMRWAHAHNDPAQFTMEWGITGPLLLAWILALLLRRRWPAQVWLQVVLPVLAVLAHSWVDFPLQIPAVASAWLLMLAMLPANAAARQPAAPAPAAAGRFQEVLP